MVRAVILRRCSGVDDLLYRGINPAKHSVLVDQVVLEVLQTVLAYLVVLLQRGIVLQAPLVTQFLGIP